MPLDRGTKLGPYEILAPIGAVLYEMVTGDKAFHGQSQASLITSIMGSEPAPISAAQSMAPAAWFT